jgi:hypothetical protein
MTTTHELPYGSTKLPGVPTMVSPPDWDILRDITHRFGWVRRLLPGGLELVMYALVVAGTVVNLLRFHRHE